MYINLNNKDYYYKQIYDSIKHKIINGKMNAGDKLPSIRKMASDLNISYNTVSNAYYQLEKEGYIKSIEKSGFYVEQLDKLLVLNKKNPQEEESSHKNEYVYDFSFSGVDNTCFHYKEMRKAFKDAITDKYADILNSNSGPGSISLRKSIANYLLSSRGIDANYNQILVSTGSKELLKLISYLLPHAKFGFENPGYAYQGFGFYKEFKSQPINFIENGIDINELEQNKIDIISVTPSHQFPTAIIMPINKRIELLNWAYASKGRYIIEDDYDGEFKYNIKPISPLKALDSNDKVIYIGNFSRTVTPALRLSYMILPNYFVKHHQDFLEHYRNPVSIFVQLALSNFINAGILEKQVNQMRKLYNKKYNLILAILSQNKNISVMSTDSGTSIVLEIRNLKNQKLFLNQLADRKVKITPIKEYYLNNKGPDNQFLLGFAKLDFNQIEEGLKRLIDSVNDSLI